MTATQLPTDPPPTPDQASSAALPPAARRYVAVVTGIGLALVGIVASGLVTDPSGIDFWTLAVLAALGAASVVAPVRFHHGGDVQGFNLTIGVFLALLVTTTAELAVLATVGAAAIGYGFGTRSVVKTAFNVGQEAIWAVAAASAATLVTAGDLAGDPLAPRRMLAVAVAAAVGVAVNVLVLGELFHRLRGESRQVLLREVIGVVSIVSLAGNTLVGVLLALLAERSPVAVVLATPLLAAVLVGYRGHAAAQATAQLAAGLQRTSSALVEGAIDDAALAGAIDGLRELFGAEHAWLDTDGARVHESLRPLLRQVRRRAMPVLDTAAGCMAVPVVLDGAVVGALAVSGRRGVDSWDDHDLALLGTVAGEVAATLRARQLLAELERERALLVSETTKLSGIVATASDGIALLDADGRVRSMNPAMAAITGVDVADSLGRRWDAVLRLHLDDGPELTIGDDFALTAALAGGEAVTGANVRLTRPGGEQRSLHCSAAPVLRDGLHDGVVLVAVDLTIEREVEELRSDFLATVSHELRTPLTPLRGFLSVLEEHGHKLGADRLSVIHGSMGKQLARLEDLIGDLLLVAELERGLSSVSPETVPVAAVVDEVTDIEAAAPSSRQRLVVRSDVGDNGQPLLALADLSAVRRVARCLISNGLKHTSGEVRVTIMREGRFIVIAVDDDGLGIAEADRDIIFAPFRRLGNHLHRTQGPGLGLAIARALAEANDGSLELTRSGSGGARFELRLPVALAPAPALRPTHVLHLPS